MDAKGFDPHDHGTCIAQGVAAADADCQRRGLQFTPVRRRVLEILLKEHRALGAYDVLEVLRDEGLGSQPPVAYRALDFLTRNGFAHRIERLNAFVACTRPGETHAPAFLICRLCDAIAEATVDVTQSGIGEAADKAQFQVETVTVEAMGLCPACQVAA